MSSSGSIFGSNLSEERWIKYMTQSYTKNLRIPPCVFRVPQTMKDKKPEAYTPQAVGLGPYHHIRPELQQMESIKRHAVEVCMGCNEFQDFIKHANEVTGEKPEIMPELGFPKCFWELFLPSIRSSYDRYLDLNDKTLAWIMMVDGIFLLYVVSYYLKQKEEKRGKKVDRQMERLARDILMLENQIPLHLLYQMGDALKLSFNGASVNGLFNRDDLVKNFTRFCVEQSPFKLSLKPELKEAAFERHLLHYMYQLIVSNHDLQESNASDSAESPDRSCSARIRSFAGHRRSLVTRIFSQAGKYIKYGYEQLCSSDVEIPYREKVDKFVQQLRKIPHKHTDHQSPKILEEEIDVPTVSQLRETVEMKFVLIDTGINNLRKDPDTNTLYLPAITLNANSEVILRNLMAYEIASAKPGSPLVLTEYLDFMCGIIDTEDDVKLLREAKIIQGSLRDDEIVSIFNGISQSVEWPDENSRVRRLVKELNGVFGRPSTDKAYNIFQKLFPVLVLILLALQYICDVVGCSSRRLGYALVSWDPSFGDGSSLSVDSQANYLMIPRKMLRYSS